VPPDTILPLWFVGPLAAFTMLVIVAHLLLMRDAKAEIPASRYRLRSVNGGIMLATVPLLAAAFSVVPTTDARLFTLTWFACVGLLGIVVTLAALDAVNNTRLLIRQRRRLREERRALLESMGRIKQGARPDAPQKPAP
jgi:hypothetical protein